MFVRYISVVVIKRLLLVVNFLKLNGSVEVFGGCVLREKRRRGIVGRRVRRMMGLGRMVGVGVNGVVFWGR